MDQCVACGRPSAAPSPSASILTEGSFSARVASRYRLSMSASYRFSPVHTLSPLVAVSLLSLGPCYWGCCSKSSY